jgi:alkylhydroperoxidase family enzyme
VPHIAVPEGKADPEVRVWALRPEMGMGAGALSHAIYEQSIVPVRERELARMRIAQINGCVICQQWRSTPGAEGAVSEGDYAHVLQWRTYDGYSERERFAIDYAERFALDHHTIDDAYYDRMRATSFTDAEILDLTVCIGGWLALGRTLHVLGLDDSCKIAP